MHSKLMKILPWSSLGTFLLALLLFWSYSGQRGEMLQESVETRQAAGEVIERFQGVAAASVQDSALHALADAAVKMPYIATMWLISPEGEFAYSTGSTAMHGTLEERVSADLTAMLQTLPADLFSSEQILLLKSASAVRSEGEHNDVYRHLVRPILTENGSWLGVVAVAYDVSPQIGITPDIWEKANLVSFGLCLLGYWISLPLWVFLDARIRGERAWIWAVFVLMGNLMALLAYLLVRVPDSRLEKTSNHDHHGDVVESN